MSRWLHSLVSNIVQLAREFGPLLVYTANNQDKIIAPDGGVYNYRTERLDDETDPTGWYERY